MKIFFDTNVYVAGALLGEAAETMLSATQKASWRIYISQTVLDETERVLVAYLGFFTTAGTIDAATMYQACHVRARASVASQSAPGPGRQPYTPRCDRCRC